jgi:hypothetical protein
VKHGIGWLILHLIGLTMFIVVWGGGDVPVIIVPGVFGALAGIVYVVGTVKMMQAVAGDVKR